MGGRFFLGSVADGILSRRGAKRAFMVMRAGGKKGEGGYMKMEEQNNRSGESKSARVRMSVYMYGYGSMYG